jgi:hypothetical protein
MRIDHYEMKILPLAGGGARQALLLGERQGLRS